MIAAIIIYGLVPADLATRPILWGLVLAWFASVAWLAVRGFRRPLWLLPGAALIALTVVALMDQTYCGPSFAFCVY